MASPVKWTAIVLTCTNKDWAQALQKELEIRQEKGYIDKDVFLLTVEDPKQNVGSGGASINALLTVAEYISAQRGYTLLNPDVLQETKILILHVGRTYLYDPCGRPFVTLPIKYKAPHCDGLLTVLDIYLKLVTDKIAVKAGPGVWVCSTDVLLTVPENAEIPWEPCDAAAITVPSTPEYCRAHGVYKLDPDGFVEDIFFRENLPMLEKCERPDGKVPVVTGLVYLSDAVVEKMMSFYMKPPLDACTYFGVDSGEPPIQLSLFFDVMLSMTTKVIEEDFVSGKRSGSYGKENVDPVSRKTMQAARFILWKDLNGFKIKACMIESGSFFYPYTITEHRNNFLQKMLWPNCPKGTFIWSKQTHSFIATGCSIEESSYIINSIIEDKVNVGPKSIISHCHLKGNINIGKDSFISGLNMEDSKIMPGCKFQDQWLTEDGFKSWIRKDKSNLHTALCKLCNKSIDLTSMGKTAITSHSKGKKHKEKEVGLHSGSIQVFMHSHKIHSTTPATTSAVTTMPSDTTMSSSQSAVSLSSYITKSETLNAEVWWCLKTVASNYSFSSNEETSYTFQQMFPDSVIAKSMSCGETKSMYVTCFGIAPYLSTLLETKVKDEPFVMLFDESLNRELQKKQLDILLRFWERDHVQSRFYTSDFLGHAAAVDLVQSFEKSVENKIGFKNLIQLSMDGPNVNWAAFNKLQKKLELEYCSKLLNIGSCGLHTIHNAFRAGISKTGWDISHKLSALYMLWDDVPARRDDYESVTKQNLYPLPFCAHRWVENVKVCERAMEIYPYVKQYVESVEKKEIKDPGTKSFSTVKEWSKDKFARAKLAFIVSVAKPVENFLKVYQTDKPMIPFLAKDLEGLMRTTLERFVKQSVMETASSPNKLCNVDVTDKNNHKGYQHIDIGFVADMEVRKLLAEKEASEKAILSFRTQCKELLCTFVHKLKEKSPLAYTLVRSLSCIDPNLICKGQDHCIDKFRRVLNILHSCQRVDINECDQIKEEYKKFVQEAQHLPEFKKFRKTEDRVDELFYNSMAGKEMYSRIWNVVRVLLLLSHGQASVERGFSVNKEVSTQNLSENRLIARRVIKDHIKSVGGLKGLVVSKELLQSAQSARQKYHTHLEAQKTEKEREKKCMKRKLMEEEVGTLGKKIKMLESDIKFLFTDANKASDKAEELRSFAHITKANTLRRRAMDKEEELEVAKKEFSEKVHLLNNI